MARPQKFPLSRCSAGPSPLRRQGSIRRTTSIDSNWPDGLGKPWTLSGRARDLFTPNEPGAEPQVLDTAQCRIVASPVRQILSIEADPDHQRVGEMVGVRAGGASRATLSEKLGDIRGTPLFQLLDDFAGASLVAGWIWSQWIADWPARARSGGGARMVDICAGFADGASSLRADGRPDHENQSCAEVGPLEHADDPIGWHAMPLQCGPQMRRARRVDLWRENGLIKVDAGFQDSSSNPSGGRTAIHEYRVFAEIDAAEGVLVALQVLPLILPYRECPGASLKATRMIGRPVANFRTAVLDILPSTMGCTHLNDVLRALADVPLLADQASA